MNVCRAHSAHEETQPHTHTHTLTHTRTRTLTLTRMKPLTHLRVRGKLANTLCGDDRHMAIYMYVYRCIYTHHAGARHLVRLACREIRQRRHRLGGSRATPSATGHVRESLEAPLVRHGPAVRLGAVGDVAQAPRRLLEGRIRIL